MAAQDDGEELQGGYRPPPLEIVTDYEAMRAAIWAELFEPKPKKRRHKMRVLPPLQVDTRRDVD